MEVFHFKAGNPQARSTFSQRIRHTESTRKMFYMLCSILWFISWIVWLKQGSCWRQVLHTVN